jgi:hypothetical protein
MPNTYTELLKTTVGTATSSVTLDLTGISGYTDLVLVYNGTVTATGKDIRFQFNGDTAGNYSYTNVGGNGSTASSGRLANSTYIATYALVGTSTSPATIAINILNYSNTTTFKTSLVRTSDAPSEVQAYAGLWRNTAAINSIRIFPNTDNFAVGSTFSLYGIANADQGAAKATGGIITEDSQYWYHTFGVSGTFTPKVALTCDYLVVAGGGGGANPYINSSTIGGGGGGAGGYRTTVGTSGGGGAAETPLSLTATGYTVTIGAGGAGNSGSDQGGTGSNSVFSTITSAGGGGGGRQSRNGGAGGSGGGASCSDTTGGAGTSNQGYAGSNGQVGGSYASGAGGGGAGAAGSVQPSTTAGGAGGVGVLSPFTGTYFAGGGGGGAQTTIGAGGNGGGGNGSTNTSGNAGVANTGGGAGGIYGNATGVNGGSGLVIVRYAK